MSVTTKVRQWFSGSKSNDLLGLALGQQSMSVCYQPERGDSQCHKFATTSNDYREAVQALQHELHVNAQANLVLNANNYQIVQIDKPKVPEQELRAALKWQVKELVSYSPDQLVLDYFDGPKMQVGQEKLNVVCAPKNLLASFVEQFSHTSINLAQISTEEFAFAALVPPSDDAHLLVCQQPNQEVLILIVKQGILYFHRRLRGHAQIGNKTEDELSFGTIDNLSLEIQRSTDYFERQLKQAPIKAIKVLLPIKTESFVARKLAENSNLSVELLDLPEPYQNERQFAASLGAVKLSQMPAKDEANV